MVYRRVNKSQFNVKLSHFLFNGLDIISAQIGMNRSEVMRLALYNLLRQTYDNKDLDIMASRDDVVEEWIEIHEKDGESLPPETANKDYSGKFNLRVGKVLHEQLTIAALRRGKSINQFCIEALKKELGL